MLLQEPIHALIGAINFLHVLEHVIQIDLELVPISMFLSQIGIDFPPDLAFTKRSRIEVIHPQSGKSYAALAASTVFAVSAASAAFSMASMLMP